MTVATNTSPLCYLVLIIQRGLKVAGLPGVLRDAAQAGLVNLPDALSRLRKTSFRASPELWKSLYTRHAD